MLFVVNRGGRGCCPVVVFEKAGDGCPEDCKESVKRVVMQTVVINCEDLNTGCNATQSGHEFLPEMGGEILDSGC